MDKNVIYPIGIDFSQLDEKLKPFGELQHEVQELILTLRNFNDNAIDILDLVKKVDSIAHSQDEVRRNMRTIINRINKRGLLAK